MNNNIDKQKLFGAIRQASGENGKDVTDALEKGDMQKVMSSLPKGTAEEFQSVLEDKEKLKQLLSGPEAQRLIKMFGRGRE